MMRPQAPARVRLPPPKMEGQTTAVCRWSLALPARSGRSARTAPGTVRRRFPATGRRARQSRSAPTRCFAIAPAGFPSLGGVVSSRSASGTPRNTSGLAQTATSAPRSKTPCPAFPMGHARPHHLPAGSRRLRLTTVKTTGAIPSPGSRSPSPLDRGDRERLSQVWSRWLAAMRRGSRGLSRTCGAPGSDRRLALSHADTSQGRLCSPRPRASSGWGGPRQNP